MPSCGAELGSKPLRYSKPGGRRRVKSASWVQWLDEEHPTGSEMLTAIFMNSYWKDDVRHWRSVEGHAHCVDALFEALPPAAVVFDSYLRFLYHVGERSLPQAFIRIAAALQRGDAAAMPAGCNSVFMLEVLLQRHVYGRPLELKRTKALREAVLYCSMSSSRMAPRRHSGCVTTS
jgi:hypothetical protein